MAEIAVTSVLGVAQIMLNLSNSNFPRSVKDDIESMRSWLSSMRAFMADNYDSQKNQTLVDLLSKIRKTAEAIEDVIDECNLHSQPYTFHRYQVTRRVHGYAHNIRHRLPLRAVSDKIASIKKDINNINSQSATFNSSNPAGPSSTPTNRVSPLLLDDEIVGYETLKTEFKRRLMVDREERLLTLALVGVAGSGKTTFVKNIFRKPDTQAHFECCAWFCASHHTDIDKISQNLLTQLCSSSGDHGSAFQLQTYLEGKRYLIVVDDIRQDDDRDRWSDLRNALPDSKRGSRIILTSSYSNLSSIWAYDGEFSLPGLNPLDAWKLFCRRAFPNRECPSELKEISSEIMVRCDRLPFAIVAVADALAQKPQDLYEWKRFHSNFGSENLGSSTLSTIYNVLLPSYMDLSSSLKSCFLYMSIFPEDQTVDSGRLVRLWVAEGFAMATPDQTAEEVAEDYLNQLIQRNLLHVLTWDIHGYRPRNCRVPSLVLNFIIKKCKDDNFASIFPNQSQMIRRRLSVHDQLQHLPENGDFASVRSMFLLRVDDPSDFEKNLSRLKLIKVLDVQGAPLTKFPEEMSRFTLLRYLSFRDTKMKIIPSSIKKLSYLETLDLQETDVTELPQEISKLHNLRHLLAYKYDKASDSVQGVKLHKGIHELTELQNLSFVKVGPEGRILKDLKALSKLRKLGVTGIKKEHGKPLWAAVQEMKSLKTLDITSDPKEECIPVEEMKHPPKTLLCLNLTGPLEKMPTWIGELVDLLWIGLKWSKLRQSSLTTLKRLPRLTELRLVDSFTGEDLIFEAPGFKKLKILVIKDFTNVNMIKIESGAMPELKQISVLECPQVTCMLGVQALKVEEPTIRNSRGLDDKLSINGGQRIPPFHQRSLLSL